MGGGAKLAALILAAGHSSRAPDFKPLLPLGDATVIEAAVGSLRRAGVRDITVVVGHRADELLPVLAALPVRPVVNHRYNDGMFASVVAGVRSLRPTTEAFFLLPADIPLVSSHTVRLLARAFKRAAADVVYPVFRGTRGHPPLISARLGPEILAWDRPEGLRPLLERHEAGALEVDVVDAGVTMDIDTPADYLAAAERRRQRHIPTREECDAILAKTNTPDYIVRHGQVVAAVAAELTGRLQRAGLAVDDGLVRTAGLLHDLAKGRPDHARCGARILKRLGYPRVAAVVAAHTDLDRPEAGALDEAAILYLADKLVKHDRIVSLDERFQGSLQKCAADPAAQAAVAGRLARARAVLTRVEHILGTDISAVIATDSPP